jgi:hypothetical protein
VGSDKSGEKGRRSFSFHFICILKSGVMGDLGFSYFFYLTSFKKNCRYVFLLYLKNKFNLEKLIFERQIKRMRD